MNSWPNKLYKKIIKEVDGERYEIRSEKYYAPLIFHTIKSLRIWGIPSLETNMTYMHLIRVRLGGALINGPTLSDPHVIHFFKFKMSHKISRRLQ